jgi:predicted transport protein
MELFDIKRGDRLESVRVKPFRYEKDIQNIVEKNLIQVFDLEFVCSEMTIKNFRIDTLCYDKSNKSFVIIEYKKGKSYSVIDQGYSYLSLMLNNKSDFILEYNENKSGNLKRGNIDWTQSKVLFISPNFSTYQKESINFRDLPIELYEIKRFSNNSIIINQIKGEGSESVSKLSKGKGVIGKVSKEVKVYSEEDIVSFGEKEIQSLYYSLRSSILELEDVEILPRKKYIGFVRDRNICSIFIQKKKIKLWVNMKKGELNDGQGIMRDVSHIGHHGIGDYETLIDNDDDIEYILSLIKQSYYRQD